MLVLTPKAPAKCSSATRSWMATGTLPPPSWLQTVTCWTVSALSCSAPGATTLWSASRPCSTSTSARVGPEVTSGPGFNGWFRRAGHAGLDAAPEDLWSAPGAEVAGFPDVSAGFPDVWAADEAGPLPLRYEWEPGAQDDGVSVEVPLAQLERLAGEGLEWQVPGLREELVLALLRALPKDLRRELVPVAQHAREFVAKAGPSDGPLLEVLAKQMSGGRSCSHIARGLRLGEGA